MSIHEATGDAREQVGVAKEGKLTERLSIERPTANAGRVVIIYANIIDWETEQIGIGGVQTYIKYLVEVFRDSRQVVLLQCSNTERVLKLGSLYVICVPTTSVEGLAVYAEARLLESPSDVLLFASEQYACPSEWSHTVVVQHGIHWDMPSQDYSESVGATQCPELFKWYDNWRNYRRMRPFRHIVCVDSKYPQWLRAVAGRRFWEKLWIVHNRPQDVFFKIGAEREYGGKRAHVLFARRLVRRRGTALFASAASSLLKAGYDMVITVSGEGPARSEMMRVLPPGDQVTYTVRQHDSMPGLYREHDIVVVPSLGSEGTSFSVVEALAAGCLVIASDVGGIGDLIWDGINGVLIGPEREQLESALEAAICEPRHRAEVGVQAHRLAVRRGGFSVWKQKWRRIIELVGDGYGDM